MRMTKMAWLNFKGSAKSFLSLILSLAFTIMIFLNFVNIIYSGALAKLSGHNKEYINIVVSVLCVVLGIFSFFYIWYSTNVFLTKRKREIGIYVFMGLTNEKIGKMYMIESVMVGVTALALGLFFGTLTTGLFWMILMAASDITVEVEFLASYKPILITSIVYGVMYIIFVVKGYFNIVRSSVLSLISAARQNEYVRENSFLLFLKTILGCGVLGAGFYLALKDSGMEFMNNILVAVILVIVGIHLIFGGLIPFIFQNLAANKIFLYQKQRNLWINQVIFRMRKNYRTYAMVSVMALSAVTALAAGFSMKNRYDNIVLFDNTYTFQFLTNQEKLDERADSIIEELAGIACKTKISMVVLEAKEGDSGYGHQGHCLVSYSDLRELAAAYGLQFTFAEPAENEVIKLTNLPLLSFVVETGKETRIISGKAYEQIEVTRVPYLGNLQNRLDMYMVNDVVYGQLQAENQELYTFNYRISDVAAFGWTKEVLKNLGSNTEDNYTAAIFHNPQDSEIDWIKILYSLCGFIFMVFIMAGGCIMLMKVYNDSTEEKERYIVMKKMGFSNRILQKSAALELAAAYGSSFLLSAFCSYFSVMTLSKTMFVNLTLVNIISVLIIFAIYAVFYLISLTEYWNNAGI